ncbi:gamma-glutamyltransferase [Methylobacterium sp. NMS14P]|uniref:gamma-glutamyltransferase n=1 Tax=Methylobacterium sp. NMS14P TaxID=2894310 RepID=UPI002359F32B|nr:gamma-glutamyltransferase [Methylobacterium sp. NMS14P]WCS28350.1 gamma-glutamyltransferase [Methylobacterium sp. NMS14P]
MRDFEKPGRSEAFGVSGMAATTHPRATLAAIEVLRAGGNAVDAAVAAGALLAVVEPTQTGIGGDCFVLLKREGQPIVAINGSGAAPAAVSVERLSAAGVSQLDPESPHAVTVPGAVRTWERLVADHGTFDFARLLAPAIEAAGQGYPVTERLARDWGRQVTKMSRHAATAAAFLPGGAAPEPGDLHVQPALAKTLQDIASKGAEVFYEGWVAEDIIETLRSLGGLHTVEDMAAFRPRYETPISTGYRGYDLWECTPNGSGVTVLAMARLLELHDLSRFEPLSVERYHLQAEIARIAYAERDIFVCDPDTGRVPVEHLISPARALALSERISLRGRLSDLTPLPAPEHKDTVFLTVVDRDRTAVSFINSVFDDFGSGIVAAGSGVLLHNRGFGFVLEPGHPNVLAGRKRPMHTILPAMLTRDGEAVLSFGVTGGHFQPIGQIQILSNLIDYGMTVQEAIDQPRMFARGDVLDVEGTVPSELVEGLRVLGHRPTPAPNPLGTAQAIWIDRKRGLLRGGADPRRDGIALGY